MKYIQDGVIEKTYFYDSEGHIWQPDKSKSLFEKCYEGPNCKLYLQPDDIVFKYYETFSNPLSYELFNVLKDVDNPHLVKLIERYYGYQTTFLSDQQSLAIDAYTKAYIRPRRTQILTNPKDYLIENVHEMESLLNMLGEKGIYFSFKYDNDLTNAGKKGLVITNLDAFSFNKGLAELNRWQLILAIQHLAMQEYRSYLLSKKEKEALSGLFYDMNQKADMALELENRLRGYQSPIDYVKHHTR